MKNNKEEMPVKPEVIDCSQYRDCSECPEFVKIKDDFCYMNDVAVLIEKYDLYHNAIIKQKDAEIARSQKEFNIVKDAFIKLKNIVDGLPSEEEIHELTCNEGCDDEFCLALQDAKNLYKRIHGENGK